MSFPIVENYDFSKNGGENKETQQALDYAIAQHYSQKIRRERIQKYYNAHNGIISQKELDSITKFTGKNSKTKFISYKIGRSKLKLVHGEFLSININPIVHTTNRDAQNRKMKKYQRAYAMSLIKDKLETVRQMGFDVYPGVTIPDKDDDKAWNIRNFMLTNEIAMQDILEDKLTNERLKEKFYRTFIDVTIVSEMHGVVERNADGTDTFRAISADNAMFEESVDDPLLERSPYRGEVRLMYPHEILTNPEFNLTEKDKKWIRENSGTTDNYESGSMEKVGGHPAFRVYTLQWKGLRSVYFKTSYRSDSKVPYTTILSEEYYKKNIKKIKKDVADGRYKIEEMEREIVWKASKIGNGIYTAAEVNENMIQIYNENGKFTAEYDYIGILLNTVNGYRVSLQEMVYELERVYDIVRFQINRELKKPHGPVITMDEALLPKKKYISDIKFELSEDGILRYNSSAEGNRGGIDAQDLTGVGVKNMGNNQILMELINIAIDVERTLDRLTGINENRQGLTKATTTATANQNNIEASRSMTYDLFYFSGIFIQETLRKLIEKTKLNIVYEGLDSRRFVMDEDQIKYLVSTRDIMMDTYGVSITDGKKEFDIRNKIEAFLPQEINAGNLRSVDVIRYMMEDSFAKSIKILDRAYEVINDMQKEQSRVSQESQKAETEAKLQITKEDREDRQKHDEDMEILRNEGKKEVEMIKGGIKGMQDKKEEKSLIE